MSSRAPLLDLGETLPTRGSQMIRSLASYQHQPRLAVYIGAGQVNGGGKSISQIDAGRDSPAAQPVIIILSTSSASKNRNYRIGTYSGLLPAFLEALSKDIEYLGLHFYDYSQSFKVLSPQNKLGTPEQVVLEYLKVATMSNFQPVLPSMFYPPNDPPRPSTPPNTSNPASTPNTLDTPIRPGLSSSFPYNKWRRNKHIQGSYRTAVKITNTINPLVCVPEIADGGGDACITEFGYMEADLKRVLVVSAGYLGREKKIGDASGAVVGLTGQC
ncbi:hypothetical protein B0H14DRAFT_3170159 [Mycena olivaceomarginata]|nr:hypothetical protein B0H14DRAFT_3170159 [Mycena olivaceomarginata]